MAANPHPNEVFAVFNGERAVGKSRSDRPELADLLESERGMPRIQLEPAKISARDYLNRFRKPFKSQPEAGRGPMHLEFFKAAMFLRLLGFCN